MQESKRISVFGLGYVGCVSMGCLAELGHTLVGVDVSQLKIDLINGGEPTIIEDRIDILIRENHQRNRIRATNRVEDAIMDSDVSIICVGTPSTESGHLNLEYIFKTAHQIGENLSKKATFHTIVIRSTVLPGTNEKYKSIIEKTSGKIADVDFAIVSNPEFLREGSAVHDYFNPPYTVLGSTSDMGITVMSELYAKIDAPTLVVDVKIAELIKYVNNSFHALKISFANEVGRISKSLNIDSHALMDLFCDDKQLNISKAYLKPGFAYGGSCLPKDLLGLNTLAKDSFVETPLLESISYSNEIQKETAFNIIKNVVPNKIFLIGLSFKEGTDDLRFSPAVDLAESLLKAGFELQIFDRNVSISRLIGGNKSYIDQHIPHLADILTDNFDKSLKKADTIVLNQRFSDILKFESHIKDKILIDLVRLPELKSKARKYIGLSW